MKLVKKLRFITFVAFIGTAFTVASAHDAQARGGFFIGVGLPPLYVGAPAYPAYAYPPPAPYAYYPPPYYAAPVYPPAVTYSAPPPEYAPPGYGVPYNAR